jgi:hypothetical protein
MQTINESSQELVRRSRDSVVELYHAVAARLRDERGQIGAEFMGLLGIAALVIGAIVALDIHDLIADAAKAFIENLKGGDKPEGFGD